MNKQTLSTKTLSTLKVIILALVLGLGISYAQAVWTGPLASPPTCVTGNPGCDAPVNIGPTAQTKTGDLTAGGLTLSKYTSSGLGSVVSPSGASYASALFLNTTFSGFYKQTALAWRWSVMENGDTNQPGKANASDFCINGGGCLGAGAGIPVGGIIMWSGSTANIPSGWKLCDGNNGTPNLSGRFIVGAGTTYAVGNQGGSAIASLVDHRHIYGMDNNTTGLNVAYDSHRGPKINNGGAEGGDGLHPYNTSKPKKNTGSSFSNVDLTVVEEANTANLPPYYALAFIMRTL